MNVKGLRISDIMNIDLDTFNKLNESELRSITSRLVSASNKRIRRLKEHDINSPAVRGLGDLEKFSTKLPENISPQQRVNRMRETFAKARTFLGKESSTIGGWKKLVKRTKEKLANDLNISKKTLESKVDVGKLFDVLHRAQEKGRISSVRHSAGSLQARNIISDMMIENPDLTEEQLYRRLNKAYKNWYEENEEDANKVLDETDESEFDFSEF